MDCVNARDVWIGRQEGSDATGRRTFEGITSELKLVEDTENVYEDPSLIYIQ